MSAMSGVGLLTRQQRRRQQQLLLESSLSPPSSSRAEREATIVDYDDDDENDDVGDQRYDQQRPSKSRPKLLDHRDSILVHVEHHASQLVGSSGLHGKALSLLFPGWMGERDNDGARSDGGDSDNDDDMYDFETASTLSSTSASESETEELNASDHSRCYDDTKSSRNVSFAKPLVTQVYTRPATKREDKYYLHYDEYDYVDFKLEYLTGRGRDRKVGFARDVVTQVHDIPTTNKEEDNELYERLFYSEQDLQG